MIYSLFLTMETATTPVKQYSLAGQLFYLLFILVLMLSMIYFGAKFVQKTKFGNNYNREIRIIDRVAIGANSYLAVVYCYERYFLISINKENTSFLAELDASAVEKEVEFNETETEPLSFTNYFKEIVKIDKFNAKNKNKNDDINLDNNKNTKNIFTKNGVVNNNTSKATPWSKKLPKEEVDHKAKNQELLKNETPKSEEQTLDLPKGGQVQLSELQNIEQESKNTTVINEQQNKNEQNSEKLSSREQLSYEGQLDFSSFLEIEKQKSENNFS